MRRIIYGQCNDLEYRKRHIDVLLDLFKRPNIIKEIAKIKLKRTERLGKKEGLFIKKTVVVEDLIGKKLLDINLA